MNSDNNNSDPARHMPLPPDLAEPSRSISESFRELKKQEYQRALQKASNSRDQQQSPDGTASRQNPAPPAAQPVAAPPPAVTEKSLYGIWDIPFANGSHGELALDAMRNFSYGLSDNSHIFWGNWSLGTIPNGRPIFFLTRRGYFPAKHYGVLGPLYYTDIAVPENETWGISDAKEGAVCFGNNVWMRRRTADVMLAATRISEMQTIGKIAEQRLKSNADEFFKQRQLQKEMMEAAELHRQRMYNMQQEMTREINNYKP